MSRARKSIQKVMLSMYRNQLPYSLLIQRISNFCNIIHIVLLCIYIYMRGIWIENYLSLSLC